MLENLEQHMGNDDQRNGAYYSDEVSLVGMWQQFVRRKNFILGITAVIILAIALYTISSPSIYRVKVIILPPTEDEIQELYKQDIYKISADKVYDKFKKNALSIKIRNQIFNKIGTNKHSEMEQRRNRNEDNVFVEFNKNLTVDFSDHTNKHFNPGITVITLDGKDPYQIADILNKFTDELLHFTSYEIIENIRNKLNAQIEALQLDIEKLRSIAKMERMDRVTILENTAELELSKVQDEINSLRLNAKKKRLDRIEILKAAAIIARTLKIKDPIDFESIKINLALPPANSQISTDPAHDSSQIYFYGYKVLEAEIDSLINRKTDDPFVPQLRDLQAKIYLLEQNREAKKLKSRKNDDPFIKGIRGKQADIIKLKNLEINADNVRPARIDKRASPPKASIKPNKRLIIIISLLIIPVFVLLLVLFFSLLEISPIKKKNML